jgi:3-deoxy-manno-octulosonate cytidylyltransferase (CMP-KDO synthetase)
MSLKVIAIIPARYGSTRFPGKPLFPIMGKTLLQRTYENALLADCLDEIIVATDDLRIFDHVKDFGGNVVMTPSECATGTDRLAEVLHMRPDYLNASVIVNIQGDEPCVSISSIHQIVRLLSEDAQAVMATVASPLKSIEEALNPCVVKCLMDRQSNALYFSRALIPANKELRFNDGSTYFRHVGLYAYRPDFILTYQKLSPTPLQMAEDLEQLKVLEHGYRIMVAVTDDVSPGVDTPEDIQKVERFICKQNTSL